MADEAEAIRTLRLHRTWVMLQEGIEGLGVGRAADGGWNIGVYTNRAAEPTKQAVRVKLAPIPVEFIETGPVKPHGTAHARLSGRDGCN